MGKLLLIRHPFVCPSVKGLCYGRTDVLLGPNGMDQIPVIVNQVNQIGEPDCLVHSGMKRTRILCDAIASDTNLSSNEEPRLMERDFGVWEMQSWDEIHEFYAEDMMGMIDLPDSWAPPHGETTYQMRDRVMEWFDSLPRDKNLIVAVTHGGPIAALQGTLQNRSVEKWIELIPACGSSVLLDL